jgi:hypothetical protein
METRTFIAYALVALLIAAVILIGLRVRHTAPHRKQGRIRKSEIASHAARLRREPVEGERL